MTKKSIKAIIGKLKNIERTNMTFPAFGYLVMYDKGTFAFGKVDYISSSNLILDIPLNFLMKFCVNHDLSIANICKIPIHKLEVKVCGRENEPTELLMRMVVSRLTDMRNKKRMLKGLSYIIIGFDDKLEAYEEYYRELSKLEMLQTL